MNTLVRISIVLLLIAAMVGSVDFILMRWLVFLGIVYLAKDLLKKYVETGMEALYFYGYVLIAILFNPIIPVYLYIRDKWIIIDIIVILFVLFQDRIISKSKLTNKKQRSFMEGYDSLHPSQRKAYTDEMFMFDAWSNDDSLFTFDDDQIVKDAIADALAEYGCGYNSESDSKSENDFKFDNQDSNLSNSDNEYKTIWVDENDNVIGGGFGYNIGDKISDKIWGEGTIAFVQAMDNGDARLGVNFKNVGFKTSVLSVFKKRNNLS